MPKESNLELKVGSFVILALLCLTIFIFSISDFAFFEKGEKISVIFKFANGLKKSAPVRIAGVDAGRVHSIKIFFDQDESKTKVEAVMWISDGKKIPMDSIIIINQLGLLGEKYIEIIPGMDTQEFLKPGDVVIGKDPIAQEEISQKVMAVASKLEKGIDYVNQIIGSEKNQQSLALTLEKLGSLTEGLDNVVTKVESGEGTIGKFFYDDNIYNNIEELTADLKGNPWKLLYKPKEKR